MESLEISNGELSNVLIHSTLKTVEVLLTYFQERYNPSDSFQGIIRVNLIRYFMPAFSKKWKQSFSGKEKRVEMFLIQNKTWLASNFSASSEASFSNNRKKRALKNVLTNLKKEEWTQLNSQFLEIM